MLIYAETNWGTRIALPIALDSTAKEVKGELERAHVNCFPELGDIRVKALMVKQKSCFYHLAESLPLGYVSNGSTDTLFVHVEPHFSVVNDQLISTDVDAPFSVVNDQLISTKSVTAKSLKRDAERKGDTNFTQLGNLSSCINGRKIGSIKRVRRRKKLGGPTFTFRGIWKVVNYPKRKTKRNRHQDYKSMDCLNHRFPQEEHASKKSFEVFYGNSDDKLNKGLLSRPVLESPSGTILESVSISGIMRKYFSIHDEVTSRPSYQNVSPTTSSHKDQRKERIDSRPLSRHRRMPVLPRVNSTPKRLQFSSPHEQYPGSSISQHKKPNVGNRLLMASSTLGLSACKQPSSLLFKKFREAPTKNESDTYIRSLVFDISDTDN